ncbi:hypothetical protein DNTS_008149 [Danionella cerebrum]|uniref:3'-5' exonuclease domain-containing protein n=1 Tax=Danionella cerebrum TaxID=2873325 RepID=A0A553PUU7_9TELE|nr:hypothetical protein DNTS_008149 [Danionella translucida]
MPLSSEESRFLDSLKRKPVKITLKDTEITGVIQKIGQSKTLVLENVCEVKTGRKFPGAKLFFGHEIVKDDFREESGVNYVVIDELHEKFGPAVSTKKVVYLFDVLLLGGQAFKNGLAMILENQRILKVVHDCRCISRCLRSEFRVKLNNVFDTQVADLLMFFNETAGFLPDRVCSLSELLKLHLRLSNTELQPVQNKEQISRDLWYIRPSPSALLVLMAETVVQLPPLRLKLLDALMDDYTRLVETYMNSFIAYNQVSSLHFTNIFLCKMPTPAV